jgi:hypothetical protein
MPDSLLAVDAPAPVTIYSESGQSPILILADSHELRTPQPKKHKLSTE